jgi:FAD synthetase
MQELMPNVSKIDLCYAHRAMDTIDGALRFWGTDELVLSFNGGKDATVLLHLVRAAMAGFLDENASAPDKKESCGEHNDSAQEPPSSKARLRCVYFVDGNAFGEMEDFLAEMESSCDLSLERFHGSYKEGCRHMIDKYGSRGFFLGTRKSDPHGQFVESFSPSSKGWPTFMRIHPILSWNFGDIWKFLREFKLPYCRLYDEGYTSLGSRFDTDKNPALLRPDGTYRPAYTLILLDDEEDMQRKGRRVLQENTRSPTASQGMCEVGMITVGDEVLSAKVCLWNQCFLGSP